MKFKIIALGILSLLVISLAARFLASITTVLLEAIPVIAWIVFAGILVAEVMTLAWIKNGNHEEDEDE